MLEVNGRVVDSVHWKVLAVTGGVLLRCHVLRFTATELVNDASFDSSAGLRQALCSHAYDTG